MEKIRVTEIRVYKYTPQLDNETYVEAGITTIESALEFDREGLISGEVGADELGDGLPTVEFKLEIVNEP